MVGWGTGCESMFPSKKMTGGIFVPSYFVCFRWTGLLPSLPGCHCTFKLLPLKGLLSLTNFLSVYPYSGLNFKPSLLVLNRNHQIDHCFTNIRQTKYLEPNLPECCFRFLSFRPLSFLECWALVASGFPYWFRGFPGIHATVLPWGLWRHEPRDLKEVGVFAENSSELGGSGL